VMLFGERSLRRALRDCVDYFVPSGIMQRLAVSLGDGPAVGGAGAGRRTIGQAPAPLPSRDGVHLLVVGLVL
jgi:hypothetical protein